MKVSSPKETATMKISILSILIAALVMTFSFGAFADYQAASEYINAGRAERQHKAKKKKGKKKTAKMGKKKANREVASEKAKKGKKKKGKKSKKHH
jgi:hypothetical protein